MSDARSNPVSSDQAHALARPVHENDAVPLIREIEIASGLSFAELGFVGSTTFGFFSRRHAIDGGNSPLFGVLDLGFLLSLREGG